MTPPPADPRSRDLTPAPRAGWVVGEPPGRPPAAPTVTEQRSARLGARLEVYSRYGALMAEAAAAVLRGDVARAEALAAERGALEEHYAELRAAEPAAVAPDFREALADALVEADHQAAVDLTLRRELTRVSEGLRALPAPEGEPVVDSAEAGATGTTGSAVAGFAGALIEARTQGVGGALSGYFPGIAGGVGGAEVAMLYAEETGEGDGAAGPVEGSRLDVRF